MEKKLIARHNECEEIRRCMESDESEFIIVCGRRRIGKTYLIEQYFDKKYDFKYVGGHNLDTRDQLRNFSKALARYSGRKQQELKDWIDAFDALECYLESLDNNKRKVVFIDEMPWIDSKRSNFVSALENFWNGWANSEGNIVLIATGSATSWMVDKLVMNKGGLHNRITSRIYLTPFTLHETEEYLRWRRFAWDRYQILQAYMAFGGIPYYLKQLSSKESVAQNIDRLCFREDGMLRNEFDELYNALFTRADSYIDTVRVLANHKSGMTRKDISEKLGYNGSNLTRILKNLERCNFIARRAQYGNKKRDEIFRLVDFYTLFYFKFLENDLSLSDHWWTEHLDSGSVKAWTGLTFELICLEHHRQIKNALGIGGVATSVSTWRYTPNRQDEKKGAQVDMVMERADRMIHLFEIKFSESKFTITKEYEETIRKRLWLFKEITQTPKAVVQTFVTTFGLSNPNSWHIVHSEVTMDDLFKS